MYLTERVILAMVGVGSFISIWFIPKNKAAKATFIFLLTQFFSWILGLIVVEFAWLDYPVREFAEANSTSFIFEYFVFPVLTVFFILNYPHTKPLRKKIAYYLIFSSVFTLFEVLAERYTLIIEYHAWKWYWTWTTISLLFYIVMVIYKWFYHMKRVFYL